jgi:hypothetical protein
MLRFDVKVGKSGRYDMPGYMLELNITPEVMQSKIIVEMGDGPLTISFFVLRNYPIYVVVPLYNLAFPATSIADVDTDEVYIECAHGINLCACQCTSFY